MASRRPAWWSAAPPSACLSPTPTSCESSQNNFGIAGHIVFTGQVPDTASYYPLMDVAVNATEGEPFGLVVLEAMAAGRPVVAYPMGGPLEIIEDGVSGAFVSATSRRDSGEASRGPGPGGSNGCRRQAEG